MALGKGSVRALGMVGRHHPAHDLPGDFEGDCSSPNGEEETRLPLGPDRDV